MKFPHTLLAISFLLAARAQADEPLPPVAADNIDQGWRLLLDPNAKWQNDPLYLPDEVNLSSMPVNSPTGNWSALTTKAGIAVTLPTTVEEHYWGKAPARKVGASAADAINGDGTYRGVSWWYRPFTAPALKPGQHLVVSFRGARLRSEVYVNGKLCGYNLITEAPFSADLTKALKPGGNLLAVRITNPGGNLSWPDFGTFQWGQYTLPDSHGFGGLDSGITMDVRDAVSVSDLAVFNTPSLKTVKLHVEVTSTGPEYRGPIALSITRGGKAVWSGTTTVQVPAGGTVTVTKDVTVPSAQLWGINQAVLYKASASLPKLEHSGHSTTFGFRWFTATGIGTDAKLMFNGRRIVPRSSISWGFWAPNGMFPDQAAADREVAAMRAIGLDSIQNHRHMPKPMVLDTFDRAGLLRYCEPGAGQFTLKDGEEWPTPQPGPIDTSGEGGYPTSFLSRYELAKVLAMVRANRSHPSVSMWTLQNEIEPNLHNPRIFNVMRQMRELDPSRIVALHSGVGTSGQVWSLPYSNGWLYDHGDRFSGWWDQHTADSSAGVYQDKLYRSPTDFMYHSKISDEISVWGEMATGASPDDHTADLGWYGPNKPGYDRAAHQAGQEAYDKFLDEFHFRTAFPTAQSLFQAAGNKHYFSAGRLLEQARMSDANDYIVLSGWESTAIDNHSGMVDSLRLLKGNTALIKRAAAPELLVIRPLHSVVAKGEAVSLDVHLINEVNRKGTLRLSLSAAMSGGNPFFQQSMPVKVSGGDVFGQLLKADTRFTPPAVGTVTITAVLSDGKQELKRSEQVLVIDPKPAPLTGAVAFAGDATEVSAALKTKLGVDAVPFENATGPLKTIVASTRSDSNSVWQQYSSDNLPIEGTDDAGLYRQQFYGKDGTLRIFRNLPSGTAKVELFFAETYFDAPGKRVFDVALNDKTVLKDFDLVKESGGKGHALIKSFEVDVTDGSLKISVPHVAQDNATLAAVRVTDSSGAVKREVFRRENYTDSSGVLWTSSLNGDFDWNGFMTVALQRVHDDGTRLVLLSNGGGDAATEAAQLADRKILRYEGISGDAGPSWLGFWYFGKKHWLLDGLPSDGVLDWPYQIAKGNGLFLHGANVEAVIGYGKNHDPNLAVSAAVVPYGKGQIVMLGLPGLVESFVSGSDENFQPVTARRIVFNALR